jgi:hypothetical protein
MKRLILSIAVVLTLAFVAAPVSAQVGQGLSGPHYNLEIIGVPKNKTADMTSGNGHVLFVPLDSTAKINFVAGTEFNVMDANCTDTNGCTIEVPSDTSGANSVCYNVYAVGLGKPGGVAVVNAECAFDTTLVGGGTCTSALLLSSFEIDRTNGGSNKPLRKNISDIFRATGCLDINANLVCDSGDVQFSNVWIFNLPQLLSYWWNYTDTGLRNMQVRFYPTTCGSITTVP